MQSNHDFNFEIFYVIFIIRQYSNSFINNKYKITNNNANYIVKVNI